MNRCSAWAGVGVPAINAAISNVMSGDEVRMGFPSLGSRPSGLRRAPRPQHPTGRSVGSVGGRRAMARVGVEMPRSSRSFQRHQVGCTISQSRSSASVFTLTVSWRDRRRSSRRDRVKSSAYDHGCAACSIMRSAACSRAVRARPDPTCSRSPRGACCPPHRRAYPTTGGIPQRCSSTPHTGCSP